MKEKCNVQQSYSIVLGKRRVPMYAPAGCLRELSRDVLSHTNLFKDLLSQEFSLELLTTKGNAIYIRRILAGK